MRVAFACLAVTVVACQQKATAEVAPAASAPARPSAASLPSAAEPKRADCGQGCALFDSATVALARVLEKKPAVLAIGETHAQAGTEKLESTTHRFTEQLLPKLAAHATELVVEIWVADPKCDKKKVAKVAKQASEVTKTQASTNQNEFVALGNTARKLGVPPDILRPSCPEYDKIAKAGASDVATMLEMIARLTRESVEAALKRRAQSKKPDPFVLTYGGALHNDLVPRAGSETWTFGPALAKATDGHYIELDLIVPEYIKDSDTWRRLPWYAKYDAVTMADSAVLFENAPGSYTLIFPKTHVEPEAPAEDFK